MKNDKLLQRVDHVINLGNSLYSKLTPETTQFKQVPREIFIEYKSLGRSLIISLYGEKSNYYTQFFNYTKHSFEINLTTSLNILGAIKYEVENGWLDNLRKIVSSEMFSDFLEMSKHLLDEGYKDAAAVMFGSILEEQLRLLCKENSIETFTIKGDKELPKKASLINDDLHKAGVYNLLAQKSIISWLDLRNNAAHGKYTEYTIADVQIMYAGILNFLTNSTS
ncbi:hypothetical protein [Chryseobacterium indoltheticum]|uniref:DUF4145 domain-containing protein n=1 Tax=Chryseobacterium indoltheticum TaxID=254 RepID=A0A3G6MXG4_9FLAO|nr:hypothetical protein [Chryseobacterium indoltheticum]AZA60204.1 hypothetical protein EG340_03745 [Chryseobacterium indoltheticum]